MMRRGIQMVKVLLIALILIFQYLYGVNWNYLRVKYGCDLSKYLENMQKAMSLS